MYACGRKIHIFCMLTQSSFIEAVARASWERDRSVKPHAYSIVYISGEKLGHKRKCMFPLLMEIMHIPCYMWANIIHLKSSFRSALKELIDFGLQHFSDVYLSWIRLSTIHSSWNCPWYCIALHTITPTTRPLWCSI